jgi:hypothetical protein
METSVKKQVYAGLFMVTLATLMYEILLTRIFSVTMWYHFAFMAISIAMFGMTVGAILVYLCPDFFSREKAQYHLSLSSLLFSITIVGSIIVHLIVPFSFKVTFEGVSSMAITYVAISVPFVFSGICVTIALTRFPRKVSKLYAADLAGAAMGCVLFKYTLDITDGPTAVIVVGGLAGLGAFLFAYKTPFNNIRNFAVAVCVIFGLFAGIHTKLVWEQSPVFRVQWAKGKKEAKPLYEKWNSFSRISVTGDPEELSPAFGWGLSSTYPRTMFPFQWMFLIIDATAGTPISKFDGDRKNLEYLKYDIVNMAHYLRRGADVLAVGVGGGRDVLSALAFDQKSVRGVEINEDILDAVNKRFGDFTGHLDGNPRVTFVNDEARSYTTRLKEKFDIIQVSLIDTWAATAAGAFVLTENSLYTVEAWKIFLEHLSEDGVLTFSRWFFGGNPGEAYRLTSLAVESLMEFGMENPRDHIMIVRNMSRREGKVGVGTILLSREPFTARDLDIFEKVARDMRFEIVLSPRFSSDVNFEKIVSAKDVFKVADTFSLNIAPSTDDKPFFFNMLRLRDMFRRDLMNQAAVAHNYRAVAVLGILLIIVVVLSSLFIFFPLALTADKKRLKGSLPMFFYFAAIGFGFILVEISQMQRLIIFLGHPTYGLSVVLFALLLSSGIGSYATRTIKAERLREAAYKRLGLLLAFLMVFGLFAPYATSNLQGAVTAVRILAAVIILFPLGFFMGMAFPMGMKLASGRSDYLTPWLWGINGATSVCGSVLAVVIALTSGISFAFWTGFACYVTALCAFAAGSRAPVTGEPVV